MASFLGIKEMKSALEARKVQIPRGTTKKELIALYNQHCPAGGGGGGTSSLGNAIPGGGGGGGTSSLGNAIPGVGGGGGTSSLGNAIPGGGATARASASTADEENDTLAPEKYQIFFTKESAQNFQKEVARVLGGEWGLNWDGGATWWTHLHITLNSKKARKAACELVRKKAVIRFPTREGGVVVRKGQNAHRTRVLLRVDLSMRALGGSPHITIAKVGRTYGGVQNDCTMQTFAKCVPNAPKNLLFNGILPPLTVAGVRVVSDKPVRLICGNVHEEARHWEEQDGALQRSVISEYAASHSAPRKDGGGGGSSSWRSKGLPTRSPPRRGTGKVLNWNAARGFGFIQPDGGGDNVFCHITELPRNKAPEVGKRVSFEVRTHPGKKSSAVNVKYVGGGRKRKTQRRKRKTQRKKRKTRKRRKRRKTKRRRRRSTRRR